MRQLGRAVTVSASILALAVQLQAQSSMTLASDAWGDAVNGVRLRVALAPSQPDASPPTTIHLPEFEVQLRNDRDTTIRVATEALITGINIDGVQYFCAQTGNGEVGFAIGPRSESSVFPTWPHLIQLFGPTGILVLRPGQHVIRVTAGVPGEPHSTRMSSNPLTIAVPDVPATVERQTLIDIVSAGEPEMWTALPLLVAKYPDAVLGAFQTAMRASQNESLPGELIPWLATVPGDDVTAFLRSQLAPSADFYSRAGAAQALIKRGDRSALSAALTTWRDLEPWLSQGVFAPVSGSISAGRMASADRMAAGVLINVLADGGDAAAIDTLARTTRQDPVAVRIAVVNAFMTPWSSSGGWTVSHWGIGWPSGGLDTLPGGAAGASIVHLLRAALDDSEPQISLTMTFRGETLADVRVCDLAAMVFALRWPDKYQFHWQASTAQHDMEIAVIRRSVR